RCVVPTVEPTMPSRLPSCPHPPRRDRVFARSLAEPKRRGRIAAANVSYRPLVNPPPPAPVLAAFGLDGVPIPLSGGRGTSFRVGNAVLKPADQVPEELLWHADLLDSIEPRGFRVARPLRSFDGAILVDGWTAASFLEGRHKP